MFYSSLSKTIALAVGVLAMVFLISYFVLAWTEPTQSPPGGNVPAPLNVSLNPQAKEGALVLGTNPAVTTGLIVQYGNVGIGTTTPAYKLDVNGDINVPSTGFLRIAGSAGSSGQVLARTATGMTWQTPAGGGIGVTQLSQGTGIILSPSPITATGTISADTTYLQRRVSGTCSAGSSIRIINSDGTVTCETDDTDGGGGGTMSSWDLYTDATFRDEITNTEDVGFDSGTGITVSWDGSRDVGFSLVDATKGCSSGQAIQSFDLSGTGNPTCVTVGLSVTAPATSEGGTGESPNTAYRDVSSSCPATRILIGGGCLCNEAQPREVAIQYSMGTGIGALGGTWNCSCIRVSGSGDIFAQAQAICVLP